MSTVQKATGFVTLAYVKTTLGIDEDSTANDKKLLDIVNIANEEVDSRLRPLLGSAPITAGTETYIQATKCAGSHARSLWYEHLGQFERATHADDQYEKKITKLMEAIRADRPERTKTEFIRGDPQDTIYQPYNIDDYITRYF